MSEKVPKGWKSVQIKEIGKVITGTTPSKNNPEYWGNEILFITPSDYKNYTKWSYDSERKLSVVGKERLIKKLLPPKSIMVTCIGSDMGKVVINPLPVITNQQINSIIVNEKRTYYDFIYYFLRNNELNASNFNFDQNVSYTYFNATSQSYIDHVFTSTGVGDIIKRCSILSDLPTNVSDHYPLLTTAEIQV